MFLLLASLAFAEQLDEPVQKTGLNQQSRDINLVVEQKMIEEISKRLDIPMVDINIEYLGLANTRRCPNPEYVDVQIPDREDFKGPVVVAVTAHENQKICGKWTLRANVAIWDSVPVAMKNIQAGHTVEYEYRKHRRDRLMISPATNLEGTIANTHIEEGSVILWNQVRAKPDNFDGDSVILLYNSGSLQIKAKGRLMSDAFIGDSVKVVSEATNSVLTGTLNEHSVVEVQRERK